MLTTQGQEGLQPPQEPLPQDPRLFLESNGLLASPLALRSRDFGLINSCRLLFYLTRRLHLTSAIGDEDSEALSRGSWFHTRLEALELSPAGALAFTMKAIADRCSEISGISKALALSDETRLKFQEKTRNDALTTHAWFSAAAQFRHPGAPELRDGFPSFLTKNFKTIAIEPRLYLKTPDFPKLHLCIQPDRLLHNEKAGYLWLLDAKTTSISPWHRAQACLIEPQPRHYCFVASEMLPQILSHYSLPPTTKLGGIIHLIIQKPTISLGQNDRTFTLKSHGKKLKMKGIAFTRNGKWYATARPEADPLPPITPSLKDYTELPTEADAFEWLAIACGKQPDREYSGEPSHDIYTQRCSHWYNGTGDYADEHPSRYIPETCPVNLSSIQTSLLLHTESRYYRDYLTQLRRVYRYATMEPSPDAFDATTAGMTASYSGALTSWAEFYTSPPVLWPSIISRQRLIQSPTDTLDPKAPSTILP